MRTVTASELSCTGPLPVYFLPIAVGKRAERYVAATKTGCQIRSGAVAPSEILLASRIDIRARSSAVSRRCHCAETICDVAVKVINTATLFTLIVDVGRVGSATGGGKCCGCYSCCRGASYCL